MQRWHTQPIEPSVIVIESEPPIPLAVFQDNKEDYVARHISQIIDTKDAFYSQLQLQLASNRLNPVERSWFSSLLSCFDTRVRMALDSTRYDPWDLEYEIRAQYTNFYGEVPEKGLPMRVIMGRLMSYGEIIAEIKNMQRIRCQDDHYDIFFSAPKQRFEWGIDEHGSNVDMLDPVHHSGVLENRGTGNPRIASVYECCHQPLNAPGCWVSIVPGQPFGVPLRYEVMQKNYWPQIVADLPYAKSFASDVQVGTAFIDVDRYVQLNEKIQKEWKRSIAPTIADAYALFIDDLQNQMDTYGRIATLEPTRKHLSDSRHALRRFFGWIFEYNKVIDGVDPSRLDDEFDAFIDTTVFKVDQIDKYFTYETRGGIVLKGQPTGVPVKRVPPLSRNKVDSLAQIDVMMAVVKPKPKTPFSDQEVYDALVKARAANKAMMEQEALVESVNVQERERSTQSLDPKLPYAADMTRIIKNRSANNAILSAAKRQEFERISLENRTIVYQHIDRINQMLRKKQPVPPEPTDDITEQDENFINDYSNDTTIQANVFEQLNRTNLLDIAPSTEDMKLIQMYKSQLAKLELTINKTKLEQDKRLPDPKRVEEFNMLATYASRFKVMKATQLNADYANVRAAFVTTINGMTQALQEFEAERIKVVTNLKREVAVGNVPSIHIGVNYLTSALVTNQYASFVRALVTYDNVLSAKNNVVDPEWTANMTRLLNSDPINADGEYKQALLYANKYQVELQAKEEEKKRKQMEEFMKRRKEEEDKQQQEEQQKKDDARKKLVKKANKLLRDATSITSARKALRNISEDIFPFLNFKPFETAFVLLGVANETVQDAAAEAKKKPTDANKEKLANQTKEYDTMLRLWRNAMTTFVSSPKDTDAEDYLIAQRTRVMTGFYDYFNKKFPKESIQTGRLRRIIEYVGVKFDDEYMKTAIDSGFFIENTDHVYEIPERLERENDFLSASAVTDVYTGFYIENASTEKQIAIRDTWIAFLNSIARYGTSQEASSRLAVMTALKKFKKNVPPQVDFITVRANVAGPSVPISSATIVSPQIDTTSPNLFGLFTQTWKGNSCWLDTVFLAFFAIPQNSISRRVLETKLVFREKELVVFYNDNSSKVLKKESRFKLECNDKEIQAIHDSLVADIINVQTHSCPNKPLGSRKFWKDDMKCFEYKVSWNKYGSYVNAIANIREFYMMEDLISHQENARPTVRNGVASVRIPKSVAKRKSIRYHIASVVEGVQVGQLGVQAYDVPLQQTVVTGVVFQLFGIILFDGGHYTIYLRDFKSNQWVYFNVTPGKEDVTTESGHTGGFVATDSNGFPVGNVNSTTNGNTPYAYIFMSQQEIDMLLALSVPKQSKPTENLYQVIMDQIDLDNYDIVETVINQPIWTSEEDRANLIQALHMNEIIDDEQYEAYFENALQYVVDEKLAVSNIEQLYSQLKTDQQDAVKAVFQATGVIESELSSVSEI